MYNARLEPDRKMASIRANRYPFFSHKPNHAPIKTPAKQQNLRETLHRSGGMTGCASRESSLSFETRPDPAECNRCNPDVACDIVLANAGCKFGVLTEKPEIPLFR